MHEDDNDLCNDPICMSPYGEQKKVLLMVQKSCIHQLRLVVYPIIYRVKKKIQVMIAGFVPSTVCLLGCDGCIFFFDGGFLMSQEWRQPSWWDIRRTSSPSANFSLPRPLIEFTEKRVKS